jgi:hypothetical protein
MTKNKKIVLSVLAVIAVMAISVLLHVTSDMLVAQLAVHQLEDSKLVVIGMNLVPFVKLLLQLFAGFVVGIYLGGLWSSNTKKGTNV